MKSNQITDPSQKPMFTPQFLPAPQIHTSSGLLYNQITLHISATTAQKMKFSTKYFFSKCDQIRNFLQIWSHLLKKSLMENFIFCTVNSPTSEHKKDYSLTLSNLVIKRDIQIVTSIRFFKEEILRKHNSGELEYFFCQILFLLYHDGFWKRVQPTTKVSKCYLIYTNIIYSTKYLKKKVIYNIGYICNIYITCGYICLFSFFLLKDDILGSFLRGDKVFSSISITSVGFGKL